MEHSKPNKPKLLESVSLEFALGAGTFHLREARKLSARLYAQLMAGGEDSIASLAFAARDLHDHLQRVSALAHQFAPSVECWDAATAEFIEICRTEAARQLAAESAATPSEEVPF